MSRLVNDGDRTMRFPEMIRCALWSCLCRRDPNEVNDKFKHEIQYPPCDIPALSPAFRRTELGERWMAFDKFLGLTLDNLNVVNRVNVANVSTNLIEATSFTRKPDLTLSAAASERYRTIVCFLDHREAIVVFYRTSRARQMSGMLLHSALATVATPLEAGGYV